LSCYLCLSLSPSLKPPLVALLMDAIFLLVHLSVKMEHSVFAWTLELGIAPLLKSLLALLKAVHSKLELSLILPVAHNANAVKEVHGTAHLRRLFQFRSPLAKLGEAPSKLDLSFILPVEHNANVVKEVHGTAKLPKSLVVPLTDRLSQSGNSLSTVKHVLAVKAVHGTARPLKSLVVPLTDRLSQSGNSLSTARHVLVTKAVPGTVTPLIFHKIQPLPGVPSMEKISRSALSNQTVSIVLANLTDHGTANLLKLHLAL